MELRTTAEARYLNVQDQIQTELNDAQSELDSLTAQGRTSSLGGASENDSVRAEFLRQTIIDARSRLRDVERGFRLDIDRLENALMLWTVWAPPLMIILFGIGFMIARRRYLA